jgi:amidase
MQARLTSRRPPLRRAINITRKKLKEAGHITILFNFIEGKEANEIVNRMWTADGGAEV